MRVKAQRDGRPAVAWIETSALFFAVSGLKYTRLCCKIAKKKLFGTTILRGKDPKIRSRNVYVPTKSHHMEKFTVIPPTDRP